MYKRKAVLVFSTLALISLMMVAALPLASDDSSAAEAEIGSSQIFIVYDDEKTTRFNADDATSFYFHLYNRGTNTHSVSATAETSAGGNISVTPSEWELTSIAPNTGADPVKMRVDLSASHYCPTGDYTLTITVKIVDGTTYEKTITSPIHVSSSLSSDKYNKFLGWFPNELESPYNNIWVTTAVSFIGLLLIGYAVMLIAVPICVRIVTRKDDPVRDKLKKLLYNLCQVIIWLWVIGQVFRIVGMSEESIDLINKLFYLAYVIVGILVGWRLYNIVVDFLIKKAAEKAEDYSLSGSAETDIESFRPLFLYIGEIVLAIVGTMLIMSLLGFNLAAVITSAGLVSLGISMGAQDVLKQFFAGLEILATRPFKNGDLIVVGSNPVIFKVRKVNVMNTLLENWDNTDINIMPNSMIVTNNIKNITRETLICKCYIVVGVAYGTDVNLARSLMQEAANQNHHVITDGSVGRPYTRLDAFGDSNLSIKMGFYVDNYNSQYSVSGQIRQDIIDKFGANGIMIDYDQVVIHQGEPIFHPGTRSGGQD